jgi:hypothetical protein
MAAASAFDYSTAWKAAFGILDLEETGPSAG